MVDKEIPNKKARGKKRQLEWTIEEDSEKWPNYPATPDATSHGQTTRKIALGEWHLAALVTLACILLAGGWLWQRSSNHISQTKGDSTTLATQSLQAVEPESLKMLGPRLAGMENQIRRVHVSSDLAELQAVIENSAEHGHITVRTEMIDFHDDLAFVKVFTRGVDETDQKETHRQTRAFRHTASGWQAVASTDDVWGTWQTWETGHLSIRYRAVDAEAVIETAPKLDQLYLKMRTDYELPLTATFPTITVGLVSEKLVDGYALDFETHTMQLPSPASQVVPVEMTAAAAFYESAIYPLTGLVLEQMEEQFPSDWQTGFGLWQPVDRALRFWAWWEATDALASQREESVHWLYQNGKAYRIEPRQLLPVGGDRVCRSYSSWEVSPTALSILLECKTRLSPWHEPKMPAYLADYVHGVWGGEAGKQGALVMTITWETMIEYMVATYGRDALPRLITAMGEHDSWQTLIPAVFGVSVEDFEAGWQAYLAEQFGRAVWRALNSL